MGNTEPATGPTSGQGATGEVNPLLIVAVVFTVLTVVGAGMLISALMGQGGVLIGVVGAVQSVACSAMLGAVVRRWRAAARAQRLRQTRGEHGEGEADAP